MVSDVLASILRSGRADFNARFCAARRLHPELETGAFAGFLQTAVEDLAQAVEKVRADKLAEVTWTAYDAALEVVGQKLAGPGSRSSLVEEGWRRILPKSAAVVATAPGRIIPAVCNALHQLASAPGVRPAQWIETMEKLGPQCVEAHLFLKLGQVAAWRAGLAHYREAAIREADALPEAVVLEVFGARPGSTWAEVRQRLLTNPWFDPAIGAKGTSKVRVVGQAGSFRGFGGLFPEPPVVAAAGEHFLARSHNESWLITADAFGATFHRASVKEFEASIGERRLPPGLKITGARLVLNGVEFDLPVLGELTSAVANATTVAVTSRLSHSIVFLALK